MRTRSGDSDPSIIFYLINQYLEFTKNLQYFNP